MDSMDDLKKVAYVYDMPYYRIEKQKSLEKELKVIIDSTNKMFLLFPLIVEIMIDKNFATQPKVQSYVDKNGNICSGKLENMWPFEGDNVSEL